MRLSAGKPGEGELLQRKGHESKKSKRRLVAALTGVLALSTILPYTGAATLPASSGDAEKPAQTQNAQQPASGGAQTAARGTSKQTVQPNEFEPYYSEVLKGWQEKGIKKGASAVTIDATKYSALSEGAEMTVGPHEGKQALIWKGTRNSWVEYQVDVPSDGLYEIQVTYRPSKERGMRRPIVWDMKVDGARPFREATSITLNRQWQDARPIKQDDDGNDIRPKSLDISDWMTVSLMDPGGAYAEPLQWYFSKGTHTLRVEGFEPVAIESFRLVPSEELKPYAEVASAYPQKDASGGELILIQAEDMASKNDSAIQLVSDTDQRSVPLAKGKITFNNVGGTRWQNQNQEITWSFKVTESGRYQIGMRALQRFISQKASYRTIKIDGKVPFQELLTYRFDYDTAYRGKVLSDETGKPFDFYLEAGEHTLSMAVTHDPFKPIIIGIEEATDLLGEITQDLRSLTGGVDDKNRTWRIAQDMPDLPERLTKVAELLRSLEAQMLEVNGRKDNISQGLGTTVEDIENMLKKVDDIPYKTDDIASMQDKVSRYIETLVQQPLQLDEIYIVPSGSEFPDMEASLVTRLSGMVKNFFYSFDPKTRLSDLDPEVLNVWVQRGRDYVNLLQELSDEMFTPETGIKVKVNLLPNPQLLILSNAAGIQPDVALGLTQDLPVDYAIRGSVHDLSKFPDFPEVYKQFSPGSWLGFYYNQGYYAVPETQSFQVLYYRKDILSRLGLPIPDTWQDVYDMLPTLQQNYMNFYINPKEFMMYFYQNNSEFFTQDGMKTALDTPEAFKAFQQWTDMFNIYAIDQEVPSFLQHFRKGTMPIGISDYNMYVQLSAAAPELNGSWGIAPLPGTVQPDGTVARWAGGGQNTGVIFEKSEKKEQAWEFLKWWISTEVQDRYGSDLEAFNGVAFRWNTSNIEAFTRLPWKREDANVILHQWSWYKEMPNLPGSYFVPREITNAWNRTVVDGMNYRSSLEIAVMDIERELRRKQQEFGFVDEAGNVKQTMELPVVNKPWEGVEAYVK